jgi:hypothetical protein
VSARATIRLDDSPGPRAVEHRAVPRTATALPISIMVDGTRHNALMRNLSSAGAMIATSAPLSVDMQIEFQCGTISAGGTVLWEREDSFGIQFDQSICERQLDEQVSRSNAAANWRKGSPLAGVA